MSEKFNNPYVGHLKKISGGKYKIDSLSEDKDILNSRNFILNELKNTFKGGVELLSEDLPHYFKALEAKYIRNKLCIKGGNTCKYNCNKVKKYTNKLLVDSANKFDRYSVISSLKAGAPFLYKTIYGGNAYDDKVENIMNQIKEIDRECDSFTSCKNKLSELSSLRNKLNLVWFNSNYCSNKNDCSTDLSNKLINITSNFRAFKDNIYTESVNTTTPTPRQIINTYAGGLYDHYTQKGGRIDDILLNKLREDINMIRKYGS